MSDFPLQDVDDLAAVAFAARLGQLGYRLRLGGGEGEVMAEATAGGRLGERFIVRISGTGEVATAGAAIGLLAGQVDKELFAPGKC